MPIWRNSPSMPKVRASSGTIGTMLRPMFLSLSSRVSARTNAMVVEISRSPVPSRRAALVQVARFVRRLVGLAERQTLQILIRDRDVEAVAEHAQVLGGELLLLVGDHLALAALAEAAALHGLRQNHGRLPLVAHRGGVGRQHLAGVVAAAVQPPDLVVRHV